MTESHPLKTPSDASVGKLRMNIIHDVASACIVSASLFDERDWPQFSLPLRLNEQAEHGLYEIDATSLDVWLVA
jgi:hypothetical protein